ncbi:MAG: hypothetical protein AAFV93_02045 [Chloroflexota bacterium]
MTAEDVFDEVLMSSKKRPSNIQQIANAFHFMKQDLVLNRERKLSEAQLNRMWRRFRMALTLMIVIFGLGGIILAVFLWGTAPEGTFPFLPPNTGVGDVTDSDQLFFFGQIFGLLFVVVVVFGIFGMISYAINIQKTTTTTNKSPKICPKKKS